MIECLCIDASNKAPEIFAGEWITNGMKYHITHVYYHPGQGLQGCALREVRLTDRSKPYGSYRLSRFAVTPEGMKALIEMMQICSDLNDIDILQLIEESELVTVKDL